MPKPKIRTVTYEARGAAADLFHCHAPECLIEGPAGTGKTRAVCEKAYHIATNYPDARVLFMRKTRASMTESVLITWERDTVPPGHECIGVVGRGNRHSYRFKNGSEVVCGGMDNPDRIMSTEYDLICGFEATELTKDDWEKANSRLRNHRVPHPERPGAYLEQAIADCNPADQFHWLNTRAESGAMVRLLSRHEDNPTVTEEYLEKLRNLTGVRRARLYLGLWVSAEGQIWENWDPNVHIVDDVPKNSYGDSTIEWYFAGVDWGFRAPGVMQVWGVDHNRTMYRVKEIYKTRENPDWWADQALRLHATYDFRSIVCDPAEPDNIDLFNHRLRGRGGKNIAMPGNNAWKVGTDIVRERLDFKPGQGKPGLFLLRGARERVDPELREALKPTSTEEEIPSYVYREAKPGGREREEEAPNSDNHGCAAMRYSAVYLDWALYTPREKIKRFAPGTYGYELDHEETLREIAEGKYL